MYNLLERWSCSGLQSDYPKTYQALVAYERGERTPAICAEVEDEILGEIETATMIRAEYVREGDEIEVEDYDDLLASMNEQLKEAKWS